MPIRVPLPVSGLPGSCFPGVPSARRGFTLVEISIVLVVIGLIVGGVLVGQEMIRSAELRSVIKDIDQFKIATDNFKSKYHNLPGDIPNATDFLPAVSAGCTNQAGGDAKTCNGNGDGQVANGTADTASYYEVFRYWQHLAMSRMLPGAYNGVAGSASATEHVAGVNSPLSRFRGGMYSIFWTPEMEHYFAIGTHAAGHPWNPVAAADEAASLDLKLDDGKPNSGNVTATGTGCATGNAYNATAAGSPIVCAIYFAHAF